VFFSFAVRYSSNPLTKRNHFGHVGGVEPNLLFSLQNTVPAFTGTNEEHQAHLTKGAAFTFWELISNGRFESNDCHLFRKPVFLFGDAIEENEEILFDGNYKWLRQIGEHRFFLPNMEWIFHCYTYSPCLFPDTWTRILSGHNQASPSGAFLTVLFSLPIMVEKFLHSFLARWNRSFWRAGLLSKQQLSLVNLWKWRVNSLSLTSERPGGCTQWWLLSERNGFFHPQRIKGTTAPVWDLSCSQGNVLGNSSEPL